MKTIDYEGHPFRAEYERAMRRYKWRTFAGYAAATIMWVLVIGAILWGVR